MKRYVALAIHIQTGKNFQEAVTTGFWRINMSAVGRAYPAITAKRAASALARSILPATRSRRVCPDRIKAAQKSGNVNPALWIWHSRPTMAGNARTEERPERAASTKVSAMGPDKDTKKSAVKGKTVGSKLDR